MSSRRRATGCRVTVTLALAVPIPPFWSVAVAIRVTTLVCSFERLLMSKRTPVESKLPFEMAPSLAVYWMVLLMPHSEVKALAETGTLPPYAMVDGETEKLTVGGRYTRMVTVAVSEVLDAGPNPPFPSLTLAALTRTVTFWAPETPTVRGLKLAMVAPGTGWPFTYHWYSGVKHLGH